MCHTVNSISIESLQKLTLRKQTQLPGDGEVFGGGEVGWRDGMEPMKGMLYNQLSQWELRSYSHSEVLGNRVKRHFPSLCQSLAASLPFSTVLISPNPSGQSHQSAECHSWLWKKPSSNETCSWKSKPGWTKVGRFKRETEGICSSCCSMGIIAPLDDSEFCDP